MKNNNELCIACGSNNLSKWGNDFKKCTSCQLIFRKKMPTENELSELYSSIYSEDKISYENTQMVSCDVSLTEHAKFICSLVKPGARILDYGAGIGDLANLLIRYGYIVDGCEYSAEARSEAKRKYGLNFMATINDADIHSYDLIIAIEVIEHLYKPWEETSKFKNLLLDTGMLYITSPNSNGLQARIKKSEWREAQSPSHLMLFNYESLKRVILNSGFSSVEYIKYSPLTVDDFKTKLLHRCLQFFNLYGGLRLVCRI
jgi:2-polyprenyl-3-methyl-5-hydroxy-6-metoxy-1,4-benzoquinol methylase